MIENNKYTFWQFLKDKKIIIPIIQRDYAQGRIGKQHIRKNFLEQLGKTLGIVPCNEDERSTELDFIYGTEYKIVGKDKDEIVVLPLDGQQRITTLWLFYWYVAFKARKLSGVVSTQLMRFSYETRSSSRDFCNELCKLKYDNCGNIVKYIQQQKWFYLSWNQDPTIKAMLCMLGGDEDFADINDGIEKLFNGHTNFASYWDTLINVDCPIYFNFLPLHTDKLPISDDLYIKMNARGKSLTDFENFKADLIDWIYKDENKKIFETDERRALFASKIDNEWTDLFWNPDLGKVDEVFFTFINRFFYNELINCKDKGNEYILKDDNSYTNLFYEYLNDTTHKNDSDSKIAYTTFSNYEFYNYEGNYILAPSILLRLEIVLDRFYSNKLNKNDIFQTDFHTDSYILPEYKKDKKGNYIKIKNNSDIEINQVSFINQQERVVFYAICKYLEKGDYEEYSFKRWMRFVYNIAYFYNDNRPYIRTISTMQQAMMLLNSVDSHNIYISLANHEKLEEKNDRSLKAQFNEEIDKAKKILQDASFEYKLQSAEKLSFFKGSVRCLFTNENGEVNDSSWNDFDTKFENAKKIFCNYGLTEEYKQEAKANRIFLSYCKNWEEQIESCAYNYKYIFGYSVNVWHNNILLLINTYAYPIHHLLMGKDINCNAQNELEDSDIYRKDALDKLVNSDVIEAIQDPSWNREERVDKYYVRWLDNDRKFCLYPSSIGVMLNASYRDQILTQLDDNNDITIIDAHRLYTKGKKLYNDWDIEFKIVNKSDFNEYKFKWQRWNTIEMYDNNGVRLQSLKDFENIPIINVDPHNDKSKEEILIELDSCIDFYEKICNKGFRD